MTQVLIVDDDPDLRFALRMVLQVSGYEVLEAENGRQALVVLRSHPDTMVVLLDRRMPDMDGLAVLEALNADPTLADRHSFVLVSAYARGTLPRRLVQLLTALSVDKVDKPFEIDDLLAAVAKAEQRAKSA